MNINISYKLKIFLLLCVLAALAAPVYAGEMIVMMDEDEAGDGAGNRLTLEDAVNMALRSNRYLLTTYNALEGNRLSSDIARSEFELKLIPSSGAGVRDDEEEIDAGISLEKKFETGPRASVSPRLGKSDDSYTGKVGISLDVPLLKGLGKNINLDPLHDSEFSVRSSYRAYYLARVNTVLETVSAVYEILKQKELVRLYEEQASRLKVHEKTAATKEKIGLATPIDIYRAQIRIKDMESSLNLAKEALRNGEDRLKVILAVPLYETLEVTAPLDYEEVMVGLDEAVTLACRNRVELEQVRDELNEAVRKSGVYRHNLQPKLNLVMDYERYSQPEAFSDSMNLDDDTWSVAFTGSTEWPRTSRKADYKRSILKVRTAQLNVDAKTDEITREVRSRLEALKKALDRIDIRNEQVRQAEGKLALAKIKFNHGMGDNFDIIEAETEIQQARANLLAVKKEYIVDTYRLRAVLGTLIDREL